MLSYFSQAASMASNIIMYMMSFYLLEYKTESKPTGDGTLSTDDLTAFTVS